MDFFEERDRGDRGGGDGGIMNAARAQTLRYSNFLITISTNVRPHSEDERDGLVEWLLNVLGELFGSFDLMNGNVLKPPGTPNQDHVAFPADNKIIKITNRIAVEQGAAQQGQIHAHVLLEVAHRYTAQEHGAEGNGNDTGKPHLGVHVNVLALRNYLNGRIPEMQIAGDRLPEKVYVNCKLLTKGTDNSNKFLTLQYLNKDRAKDNGGGERDLRADGAAADPHLRHVQDVLLNGDPDIGYDPETHNISKGNEDLRPPRAPGMRRVTVPAPTFVNTNAQPPNFVQTTQPAPSFVRTTQPARRF
jgi:hypothetical protein